MRKIVKTQTDMFTNNIEDIKIDTNSRDEMPAILVGLREIYRDTHTCITILHQLQKFIPTNVDINRGRPGMDLWHILVLGVVRLSHNCDFDKLTDLANNHRTLRLFLDLEATNEKRYGRQTLIDNISFFTPEILIQINDAVVQCGYRFLNSEGPIKCRVDSFVFETNVHFPTDITLVWDAVRSVVTRTSKLCHFYEFSGWREVASILKKIHKSLREIQLIRKGKPKNEDKIAAKRLAEISASNNFYKLVDTAIKKAEISVIDLLTTECSRKEIEEINSFISKTKIISQQLIKRVVDEEKITHDEKIFSIFEEYTEWISKGKAGVSQELGVRLAVVEGDFGFILNWNIMYKKTDDKVAVSLVEETIKKYPVAKVFSFDKGFWSPQNKKDIEPLIDTLILPQKGKESKATKKITTSPEYRKLRFEHSRIESAINALENHGLDRCPDKGKDAYERYVGLAIVARNILQLGKIVMAKEKKKSSAA